MQSSRISIRLVSLALVLAGICWGQLVDLELVVEGLDRPTAIAAPGDDSGRLFFTYQTGVVGVYDGSRGTLPREVPVLSVSVACCGERGLLGLAFHPNFAENGYLFVNYTRAGDGHTVVERYTLDPPSSNVAAPGSAKTILVIPQPAEQHNAGDLKFGPDGYLYIATGDGGFQVPPSLASQDPESLLGKILRIDVDGGNPYRVPDNPSGNEVWAMGLRNPWRFSFDRATTAMIIGDVGWGDREEINVIPAGTNQVLNFGWPLLEGERCLLACDTPGLIAPVLMYGHGGDAGAQSIVGGYTYRGSRYAAFVGLYFHADFVSGRLWLSDGVRSIGPIETGLMINTFGEDPSGELYVADYGNGRILHIAGQEIFPDPPEIGAVVNGASFAQGQAVAPGSIATVFANNLGDQASSFVFPATSFNGLSVTVGGTPAALFAVVPASGQINFLVPNTLPTTGSAPVVVSNFGASSQPFELPLAPRAPGIFAFQDPSNPSRVYAASLLSNTAWLPVPDETAVGLGIPVNCETNAIPTTSYCGRPARAGDVMQFYVTGLGEATSTGAPGGPKAPLNEPVPATPLYYAVEIPQITVGGIQATVLFAGHAPGFAGLDQVNFEIPANAPVGDEVPVTITDSSGRTDVRLIAIQGP